MLKCLTLLALAVAASASVSGIIDISGKDKQRLLQAITSGFIKLQPDDLDSVYYAAKGFDIMKEPLVKVLIMDSCAHLEYQYKPETSVESTFHALAAWKILKCVGKLENPEITNKFKKALEKPTCTSDVRYGIEGLQLLGQQIPNPAKVAQVLQQKLKEDDSLLSLGNGLHAAAMLGNHGKFAMDRVEDVVVQADEVDGKMLQWEGGLSTTGLLLTGLFKLKDAKALSQNQADKFAAYLLTRKSVQTAKGALALIEASMALSESSVSPVSITLAKSSQVTLDKPDLIVKVSNLLGKPLKQAPSPVVALSATRLADDVVVLSKQPLTPGSAPTEYVLPLKLEPGQYKISLTAGSHTSSIVARVLGPIKLQSLEIGLGDSDGSSAPKMNKIQQPNKVNLQGDSNQNLIVKFSLPRSVHQAYLRLYEGKKEIIFIAEKDNSQLYKINVNLANELTYTGNYNMELILGDSIVSNGLRWDLGSIDVKLTTTEGPNVPTHDVKPEIEHMFRVAEKRPPQAVSMFFTVAAASPLLLLLIIWMKIGLPFNYFNIYSVPFHLGYAGILALYTWFWLCGNMFSTCVWLVYIGGFTFIAGNRMLRNIATDKK